MHHEAENGCVIAAGADTGVGFGSCSPPSSRRNLSCGKLHTQSSTLEFSQTTSERATNVLTLIHANEISYTLLRNPRCCADRSIVAEVTSILLPDCTRLQEIECIIQNFSRGSMPRTPLEGHVASRVAKPLPFIIPGSAPVLDTLM